MLWNDITEMFDLQTEVIDKSIIDSYYISSLATQHTFGRGFAESRISEAYSKTNIDSNSSTGEACNTLRVLLHFTGATLRKIHTMHWNFHFR